MISLKNKNSATDVIKIKIKLYEYTPKFLPNNLEMNTLIIANKIEPLIYIYKQISFSHFFAESLDHF